VGPRADEPGPFLPATFDQLSEYDAGRQPGQVQGPQRPAWLTKHVEYSADATYNRMYEAELEQILSSAARTRKEAKKHKDKKKKKKTDKERKRKKRKKEKSREGS
jgi:dipeptidase